MQIACPITSGHRFGCLGRLFFFCCRIAVVLFIALCRPQKAACNVYIRDPFNFWQLISFNEFAFYLNLFHHAYVFFLARARYFAGKLSCDPNKNQLHNQTFPPDQKMRLTKNREHSSGTYPAPHS
jgi:hypothetical protein